jgi:hypothetical protein
MDLEATEDCEEVAETWIFKLLKRKFKHGS